MKNEMVQPYHKIDGIAMTILQDTLPVLSEQSVEYVLQEYPLERGTLPHPGYMGVFRLLIFFATITLPLRLNLGLSPIEDRLYDY
jgi:hypothetical protein